MWDLLPSDDERMIAEAVREYLAAEQPLARLRPAATNTDRLSAMAELGWFTIGLSEAAGGGGMGLVAEAIIQRECGRYLVSPSALAVVLAEHLAWHSGREALHRTGGSWSRVALAIDAQPQRPGRERAVLAFDSAEADWLVYWNGDGMGLFAQGVLAGAEAKACFDESLQLAVGSLAVDLAALWVPAESAPLASRAQVLLAAALVGLAEHACDLAVDYAKVREQFGKPIGAFQAIKHRCADMAIRQRLSWYQTSLACLKLEAASGDADLQIASAKLLAADAAHENGRACVQIHGGIGFQAECDAHWFLKRARVYDQAGGDMEHQAVIVASAA